MRQAATEPQYTMDQLKANNWRMVICYYVQTAEGTKGHSVYARDYDFNNKTFSCVNSWGNDLEPHPTIEKDKVYGLFYVSMTEQIN